LTDSRGRTLVIGANGNVGTLLLQELVRRGETPLASLRPGRSRPPDLPGVEWVEAELSRPESLGPALARAETVIWTPAVWMVPACLGALEAAAPRRFVVISSASVHTKLASGGARTKRAAEARIRESKLPWTIVRPTMIYGNVRDRNIARLLDYLERWPVFPLFGDGSGLMQPVFIHDLVAMILRAAETPAAAGQAYDFGAAETLSYRSLVETAARALGRRTRFAVIPLGLAAGALRTANRVGLKFLREEQALRLAEDKVVDNGPALRDLGATTRTFADGVALEVRERREARRDG
jgi:uncharacterized protein YbjT (DUF2867 family)